MLLAAVAVPAAVLPATAVAVPARAQALCGSVVATAPPQHVLIVVLDNRCYNQVIGRCCHRSSCR